MHDHPGSVGSRQLRTLRRRLRQRRAVMARERVYGITGGGAEVAGEVEIVREIAPVGTE